MKKIALFYLLFCSSLGLTQSYSISAGVSMAQNKNTEHSTSFESTSYQSFDNFAIIRIYQNENNYQQIYKAKAGFYISLIQSKVINSNWKIDYGIRIDQARFNYEQEYTSGTRSILSLDTVSLENNMIPTFSSSCDVFTNNFSDIERRNGTDYTILNLSLPVEITYLLFKDIHLSIGGSLLTPIKSKTVRDILLLDSETIDDVTYCEYLLNVSSDHSGDGLSNLQFSVSGRLSYFLNENISIDLGVSQMLSHRFDHPQNSFSSSTARKNYKPLFSSLGVSYHFNSPDKNMNPEL